MKTRATVYNKIVTPEALQNINKKNIDLMNDYLDYMASIDRAESTNKSYRENIIHFFVWNLKNNDNKFFTDLKKREIIRWQKHCLIDLGWSGTTFIRNKESLSSMSNFIEDILEEEFPTFRNLFRRMVSPGKEPVREKTIISDDEVQMILDTLVERKKYQYACIFALACFGGARKSELLRYKVSYFDDANIMPDTSLYATPEKLKTKGRGRKGKLLTKYTLTDFKPYFDLYMEWRKSKGFTDCEYLFVKHTDGTQLQYSSLEYWSKYITTILGRPFYCHCLRHQLCSRLFRMEMPSEVVQEYFGWTSAEMLRIYNDNCIADSFSKYFPCKVV